MNLVTEREKKRDSWQLLTSGFLLWNDAAELTLFSAIKKEQLYEYRKEVFKKGDFDVTYSVFCGYSMFLMLPNSLRKCLFIRIKKCLLPVYITLSCQCALNKLNLFWMNSSILLIPFMPQSCWECCSCFHFNQNQTFCSPGMCLFLLQHPLSSSF